MPALSLTQSVTAVGPNVPAFFLGSGGTAPYAYAIIPGGPGGMINPSTGAYIAAPIVPSDPSQLYDTVRVTDAALATATAQILVGTPLLLFCEIIQREMGLQAGRVYCWDQKINQPKDSALYIAVSVPISKPFGNSNRVVSGMGGMTSQAYISVCDVVDVDIISRGPAARDRKAEVLLALGSTYAEQQQEINGFTIGRLPLGGKFLNLSEVDGAAIPYRYRISFQMLYAVSKTKPIAYYDTFAKPTLYPDP